MSPFRIAFLIPQTICAFLCVGASAQAPILPFSLHLQNLSGETSRAAFNEDDTLRFWAAPPQAGAKSGAVTADPVDTARSFVDSHHILLGLKNATANLTVRSSESSGKHTYVRFYQAIGGVPVFGAAVLVQVDANGNVASMLSDVLRDTTVIDNGRLSLAPGISAESTTTAVLADRGLAKRAAGRGGLYAESAPKLVLYAPSVFNRKGEPSLCWHLTVASTATAAFREALLVDAHSGRVVRQYSLIHDIKNRSVYDANNTQADPGTLRRSEGQGPSGIADVDEAYDNLGDTYDFYFNEHGRDSIDGAGMPLSAIVRICEPQACPLPNAFWNGSRMYFGDGFAVDDVTAHELTHGVTQHESALVYMDESGALNESFSDIWGEFVDLTNGTGNDTAGVRWLMGEDIPGGPIRDMADPTAFNNPDHYYSPYYYYGGLDGGGVHWNSGVCNKLCFLLTDGGTLNGRTIAGMGIPTVADLFYEAQTNLLTDASGYADLYTQLTQAAVNLGLSQVQRDNIELACRAVQIGGLPQAATNFEVVTAAGNPNPTLSWSNPAKAFDQVILVRKQGSYPGTPTDGTVVYSGTGTGVVDGPLTLQQRYNYSLFAYHGQDEFGDESYSAPARQRVRVGFVTPSQSHTEDFFQGDNDLDNKTITFTPAPAPNYYLACTEAANAFPTNPAGGTNLVLDDDDYSSVALASGEEVTLFGQSFDSVYVGSNGYVTMEFPDTFPFEDLDNHFGQGRVSALYTDLDPSSGGQISHKQLADRLAITWTNVPEYGSGNSNNFQVELFFDGRVAITFLTIDAPSGITGLSPGEGSPENFAEDDLSVAHDCVEADSDGDGIGDSVDGFDDFDGDTIPNYLDTDSDDDGILDINETANDADNDGSGNFIDLDSDGDGIPDAIEAAAPADPDGDTIPNFLDTDSDGDGTLDSTEAMFGSDPYDAGSVPDVPLGALSLGLALGAAAAWRLQKHRDRRSAT